MRLGEGCRAGVRRGGRRRTFLRGRFTFCSVVRNRSRAVHLLPRTTEPNREFYSNALLLLLNSTIDLSNWLRKPIGDMWGQRSFACQHVSGLDPSSKAMRGCGLQKVLVMEPLVFNHLHTFSEVKSPLSRLDLLSSEHLVQK